MHFKSIATFLGPNHTQYKISLTFSYKTTFERELRPHTPLYVSFSYKLPSNCTTKQDAYKCRVPQSSSAAGKRRNDKMCLFTPLAVSYMMYATLTFSWKLSWRLLWHRTKTWFYTECGLALSEECKWQKIRSVDERWHLRSANSASITSPSHVHWRGDVCLRACNIWLPQGPSYSMNVVVHIGKQRLCKPRDCHQILTSSRTVRQRQNDDLRFCLPCEKCESLNGEVDGSGRP